jgi:hypothetical protein
MERHNHATRLIASSLTHSESRDIRNSEIILDAGRTNHLDLIAHSRVPDEYLPQELQGANNNFRPDILLTIPQPDSDLGFHMHPTDSIAYKRCTSKLLILEVGFGSDFDLAATQALKAEQHRHLTQALTQAGWKGTDVYDHIITVPLIFGHSGSVLIQTRQALMKHLKLPYRKAEKLCSTIGHMAIEKLAHITVQRHKLVAQLGSS